MCVRACDNGTVVKRLLANERSRADSPLFEAAGSGRDLRVVVDLAVDEYNEPEDVEKVDLLHGLLASKMVQTLEYDERGAPASAQRISAPVGEAAVGWIEVQPEAEPAFTTHLVIYSDGAGVTMAAISGDQARGEILRDDTTYAKYTPDEAAVRRHSDSVAMAAAFESGADVMVTNRPFLLSGRWRMPGQMTVCDPNDALAVVGLFLRLRSSFVAWATPEAGPIMNFNRGVYFWVGTRALLPAGWRWFSYCVESDAGHPDAAMTLLAQSLFQRVARASRKRDSLMLHMSRRQDNDVAEDALTDLDHILVLLVGAFDVLARVAHRSASLSG